MKPLIALLTLGLMTSASAFAFQSQPVEFRSQGEKLKGTLYLPDSYKKGQRLPAVVVTGAWTTVKEQMPKTYALEMANAGYAALVFDFRGWGESGGKNRYLEDPERKTQDIVAAVDYLSKRPEVKANQMAGLGICASSGYMADAYTRSSQLKTIALVAPWLHDKALATQIYGGEKGVEALLKKASAAKGKFKKSGQLTTITAASSTDKNSLMFKAPYYTEKDRGLIKEYDNKFNIASWDGWLNYNALSSAKRLRDKILLVGSPKMALPQGADAYQKLAPKKVERAQIADATQFDFYDKPKVVKAASKKVTQYFQKKFQ